MRRTAVALVLTAVVAAGCHKKTPPVARPAPAPPAPTAGNARPPAPPQPVPEPTVVPPEPVRDDAVMSASLDDLNRNSPLKPVYFDYDSDELTPAGQQTLNENAALMKKFPNMEHDEPYMAHVPPGKQREIVWTFNRTGEFDFACLLPGHYEAGMVGRIRVVAAGKKAKS